MKRFNIRALGAAIAGAAAFALAACGTATPYQPLQTGGASPGGYSELQISHDRYRVNFQGNTLTDRETVERYLLFRAAELTVQEGYDWFKLVDRNTERQSRNVDIPHTETYWAWTPSWYYRGKGDWVMINTLQPFWYDQYETFQTNQYQASAEVFLGHGDKTENDPSVFNAREVIQNLAPTIQRPEAAK